MASAERFDVQVEYDYQATEDDELTILPGEIITDVECSDGGWWSGTLRDKRGVFPDNFVKIIGKSQAKSAPTKKAPMVPVMSMDKPTEIVVPQHEPEGRGNKKKVIKAKVVYPYTPANDDELELVMGDVIEIVEKSDENWWEGELDGKRGMFPSNFVEVIDDSAKEVKPKKVIGVGFGDIFAGGEAPKLRPTTKAASVDSPGDTKPNPVNIPKLPATSRTSAPKVPTSNSKKPVDKARVLFGYDALNEDELTLAEGEIVTIVDKNLEDAGWWKGQVNGRTGVFPDNFVQLLPLEESQTKAPSMRPTPPSSQPPDEPVDHHKAPPWANQLKKPLAPPVSRKPTKPVETPASASSPHENQRSGDHVHDDHITLPSHTKDRAKPPNTRKPPSKKNSQDLPEADEHIKSAGSAGYQPQPQQQQPETSVPGYRKSVKLTTTGSLDNMTSTTPSQQKTEDNSQSQEIAKLRKELDIIKSKSVFKEDYDSLKSELATVKTQLQEQRDKLNKEVKILMEDIDEVKKERANMKVELDRVKKLVAMNN